MDELDVPEAEPRDDCGADRHDVKQDQKGTDSVGMVLSLTDASGIFTVRLTQGSIKYYRQVKPQSKKVDFQMAS